MQALVVIDAQNEFSASGKRPVSGHEASLKVIALRVEAFRHAGWPIAWVRHHNLPEESPAFLPGSWGAEFSPGMGPLAGSHAEKEFQKTVYGAFTGTDIHSWLKEQQADSILLVGFFTHGCVSTTAREAIMLKIDVSIDAGATGSFDLTHERLGHLPAAEVRRSALLQLANMGAHII